MRGATIVNNVKMKMEHPAYIFKIFLLFSISHIQDATNSCVYMDILETVRDTELVKLWQNCAK